MRRLMAISAVSALACPAFAALNTTDPSIIVLHRLDEQTSGNLNNDVTAPNQFFDTAPTGTAQNHDNFEDGASNGPAWGSGAAFSSGATTVGTGTGLVFDVADRDHTRYSSWMHGTETAYTPGTSFTIMVRAYANTADNAVQGLTGTSSNFLQLSGGGSAMVLQSRIREGAGGGEDSFYYSSGGNGGLNTSAGGPITAGGGGFLLQRNTWYNLFLIYEANTSVTLAADDGTTFQYITTTEINNAAFNTLANGFADADRPHGIGVLTYGPDAPNTLDGRIESVVVFNKALSTAEADAINLDNAPVPEPAAAGLLAAGLALVATRRNRN